MSCSSLCEHLLGNTGLENTSHCPVLFRMLLLFVYLCLKLYCNNSLPRNKVTMSNYGGNTARGRNISDCILTHILSRCGYEAVMKWSLFAYLMKVFLS